MTVTLGHIGSDLVLEVKDDGAPSRTRPPAEVHTGMGLLGMRERIGALGGSVTLNRSSEGAVLRVSIPLARLEGEEIS